MSLISRPREEKKITLTGSGPLATQKSVGSLEQALGINLSRANLIWDSPPPIYLGHMYVNRLSPKGSFENVF